MNKEDFTVQCINLSSSAVQNLHPEILQTNGIPLNQRYIYPTAGKTLLQTLKEMKGYAGLESIPQGVYIEDYLRKKRNIQPSKTGFVVFSLAGNVKCRPSFSIPLNTVLAAENPCVIEIIYGEFPITSLISY